MRIIYPYSSDYDKEENLAKQAQQQQQAQKNRDKWQTASIMLDALAKLDPNNDFYPQFKAKADAKQINDQDLAMMKAEVLKELPVLKSSVETLARLVYQLP